MVILKVQVALSGNTNLKFPAVPLIKSSVVTLLIVFVLTKYLPACASPDCENLPFACTTPPDNLARDCSPIASELLAPENVEAALPNAIEFTPNVTGVTC